MTGTYLNNSRVLSQTFYFFFEDTRAPHLLLNVIHFESKPASCKLIFSTSFCLNNTRVLYRQNARIKRFHVHMWNVHLRFGRRFGQGTQKHLHINVAMPLHHVHSFLHFKVLAKTTLSATSCCQQVKRFVDSLWAVKSLRSPHPRVWSSLKATHEGLVLRKEVSEKATATAAQWHHATGMPLACHSLCCRCET